MTKVLQHGSHYFEGDLKCYYLHEILKTIATGWWKQSFTFLWWSMRKMWSRGFYHCLTSHGRQYSQEERSPELWKHQGIRLTHCLPQVSTNHG